MQRLDLVQMHKTQVVEFCGRKKPRRQLYFGVVVLGASGQGAALEDIWPKEKHLGLFPKKKLIVLKIKERTLLISWFTLSQGYHSTSSKNQPCIDVGRDQKSGKKLRDPLIDGSLTVGCKPMCFWPTECFRSNPNQYLKIHMIIKTSISFEKSEDIATLVWVSTGPLIGSCSHGKGKLLLFPEGPLWRPGIVWLEN